MYVTHSSETTRVGRARSTVARAEETVGRDRRSHGRREAGEEGDSRLFREAIDKQSSS